jgi:3-isopropylmalate/(R)-2-methylmalate dehydratase small subunit
MESFTKHTGLVVALDRVNVDTDQIIPKQFLKRIERTGYGQYLFFDWRFSESGEPDPEFVLNDLRYKGASVLITGRNFGCGSSREHAPWALQDYGFRVIMAPSFADIFRNNCLQNGILPIELTEDQIAQLSTKANGKLEGYEIAVDLELQSISDGDGLFMDFKIDEFRRYCLLNGLDDIGLTLLKEDKITEFEHSNGII